MATDSQCDGVGPQELITDRIGWAEKKKKTFQKSRKPVKEKVNFVSNKIKTGKIMEKFLVLYCTIVIRHYVCCEAI